MQAMSYNLHDLNAVRFETSGTTEEGIAAYSVIHCRGEIHRCRIVVLPNSAHLRRAEFVPQGWN